MRRQKGAALMLLMLVLVIGVTTFFVASTGNNRSSIKQKNANVKSLATAKEALLDYVIATSGNGLYGYLPCPDNGTNANYAEGDSHTNGGDCANAYLSVSGRLPWRTLGMEPIRDDEQECLWYVVSGTHNAARQTNLMVNWDTNGQLQLFSAQGTSYSSTPADRPIALIISPGKIRLGQDRSTANNVPPSQVALCGGNYTASDYLDAGGGYNNAANASANALSQFISDEGEQISGVNDRILAITRQDLVDALKKRTDFPNILYDNSQDYLPNNPNASNLTQLLALCVAAYGNAGGVVTDLRLPWPADIDFNGLDYRNASYYDDTAGRLFGRLPDTVNNSEASTGKGISNLITSCSLMTASDISLWRNWKDHFFLMTADAHAPNEPSAGGAIPYTTPTCDATNCITINGGASYYAAVVLFAGERTGSQVRSAPPAVTSDPEDKASISNYLEGANATYSNHTSGAANLQNTTGNDVLYCIDQLLNVTPC